MEKRLIGVTLFVLAIFAAVPATMSAQNTQRPSAGNVRVNTATPDLSGVWLIAPGNRGPGRSKDDPLPLTPWAAEMFEYNTDGRPGGEGRVKIEMDTRSHCAPASVQFLMTYNDPFEIIQSANRVLIFYEYDHLIRQIWLDEKLPDNLEDIDPTWIGTSYGRWEGDTLVVDTVRMHPDILFDNAGHVKSDKLRFTERFRRAGQKLEVETTFTDEKAFTRPWSQKMTYDLKPGWKLKERVFCEDKYKKGIYE